MKKPLEPLEIYISPRIDDLLNVAQQYKEAFERNMIKESNRLMKHPPTPTTPGREGGNPSS